MMKFGNKQRRRADVEFMHEYLMICREHLLYISSTWQNVVRCMVKSQECLTGDLYFTNRYYTWEWLTTAIFTFHRLATDFAQ